jgi:hypothetical protein
MHGMNSKLVATIALRLEHSLVARIELAAYTADQHVNRAIEWPRVTPVGDVQKLIARQRLPR